MNPFPFPNKENSMKILLEDPVITKIDAGQITDIFEDAWECGRAAAEGFLKEHPRAPGHMEDFLKEQGFQVQVYDTDYVLGNRRYFCEYYSAQNIVKIYRQSVQLWCRENGFDYLQGCSLLLCHEYYHHLEWHKLGMTSRRYLVPMLKLGPWHIGKTGVPALSEVGANAFAEACFYHMLETEEIDTSEGERHV